MRVIHYFRADGDYGDHTTGNYNDYWGLHLWGDITETIDWTAPKPFLGDDEYGRFAWVNLAPDATNVGFIVHRGDTKDGTDADRFFNPSSTPEIWLKEDDAHDLHFAGRGPGLRHDPLPPPGRRLYRLGAAPVGRRPRPGRGHGLGQPQTVRRRR